MSVTPTSAELEILKLLWQQPRVSGRELHDQLEPVLQWGYSSTRKTLERMVEAGLVTAYDPGSKKPVLTSEFTALLSPGSSPSTGDQVRERATDALSDEVRRMLDEGVVSAPQDIDLCMLLGAGWPFWLGGICPYLDRSGSAERVTGSRFLPPGVASVPA